MFKRLVTRIGAFPLLLDFVHAFGFKLREEDDQYGGYHQRINRCSDEGHQVKRLTFGKQTHIKVVPYFASFHPY